MFICSRFLKIDFLYKKFNLLIIKHNIKLKTLSCMLYHVIIALNSAGHRNVGPIITTLERLGLELVGTQKRISSSRTVQIPNLKLYVIQYRLNELDAMEWYRLRFSDLVLQKKLDRLFRNHIELFFESETDLDSHELWVTIRTEVFPKDRKFPLMFVVRTSGENGTNIPFIPDDFDSGNLNLGGGTL